jgi:hypothetical protein
MPETNPNWADAPRDGSVIKVWFREDTRAIEARWVDGEWHVWSPAINQWVRMTYFYGHLAAPEVWWKE